MAMFKGSYLFPTIISGIHVSFQGCIALSFFFSNTFFSANLWILHKLELKNWQNEVSKQQQNHDMTFDYRYTTWKVDGGTTMYWFIMAPY